MTIREVLEVVESGEYRSRLSWSQLNNLLFWGLAEDGTLHVDGKAALSDAGRELLAALRKADALDAADRVHPVWVVEVQRWAGGGCEAPTLYELGRKLAEGAKRNGTT